MFHFSTTIGKQYTIEDTSKVLAMEQTIATHDNQFISFFKQRLTFTSLIWPISSDNNTVFFLSHELWLIKYQMKHDSVSPRAKHVQCYHTPSTSSNTHMETLCFRSPSGSFRTFPRWPCHIFSCGKGTSCYYSIIFLVHHNFCWANFSFAFQTYSK